MTQEQTSPPRPTQPPRPPIVGLASLIHFPTFPEWEKKHGWKGTRLERLAEELLKKMGCLTDRAQSTGRRFGERWSSQSNDRFGAFDLIALKEGHRDLYLQVTASEGNVSDRKEKIDQISRYLSLGERDVQIWTPLVAWGSSPRRMLVYFRRYICKVAGEWSMAPMILPVPTECIDRLRGSEAKESMS